MVVALVAPVDQASPEAALVVPHHLTIVLLVKILIIIDLVKAKSETFVYILKIKANNCNIINCQPLTGNLQILTNLLQEHSIYVIREGLGDEEKSISAKKLSQQAASLLLKAKLLIIHQDRSQ